MLTLVLIGLVLFGLVWSSCSGPSSVKVEEEMEYWLGGDVPSDFDVVQSSYSFAISDDVNTARLDFTPDGYAELLRSINPALADSLRSGKQVYLRDESRERFNNYFLLSVWNSEEQMLQVQFGHE